MKYLYFVAAGISDSEEPVEEPVDIVDFDNDEFGYRHASDCMKSHAEPVVGD